MTTAAADHRPDSRAARESDRVVIKCLGLTKIFRDFWLRNRVRAVDNVDLEIRRGEVFGLLGPNGSGKSTTIKMILGLLNPTAGRISVFGHRPEDVATKKIIGYLPEESYLYRFLNARETLEYYGRLFHQSGSQSAKRIDMLLEMVGLDAAQRRPVGEYSKGMQRRIGMAQALINDPQLLILDEPTTGLDPMGSRMIKDLIISLARRGKTILLCSHQLADVEDVCDRMAIMFGGKVRAMDTTEQLLIKKDQTTIQTARLDAATIEQVRALLARNGKTIDSVEHPRQKLESLFLEIVERAQAEGLATSGARSGGKIADFLVSGDEDSPDMPAEAATQRVVDRLMTPAAPAPEPESEPAPPASAPASQPPAQDVLDDLLRPADHVAGAGRSVGHAGKSLADSPQPASPASEQELPDQAFLDALLQAPPNDPRKSPPAPGGKGPAKPA